MQWIIQIPVLLFSIILHEYAHGWAAYRKGDDTAYLLGRLTLNPLSHLDLVGTVILPGLCILSGAPMIGWAKPVPVNPLRLEHPRKDMSIVALSGPLANFTIVVFSIVSYKAISVSGMASASLAEGFLTLFRFAVIINLALAFFNLLPVFPLDGSQILLGVLPDRWLRIYERHIPYGMYIILFMLITGVLKFLILAPMVFTLGLFAKFGLTLV